MKHLAQKIAARWIQAVRAVDPNWYTVSPSGHMVFYFPARHKQHAPLSWAVEDAEAAQKGLKKIRSFFDKKLGIRLTNQDEPRFYTKGGQSYFKIAVHARTDRDEFVPALKDYLGFGPAL